MIMIDYSNDHPFEKPFYQSQRRARIHTVQKRVRVRVRVRTRMFSGLTAEKRWKGELGQACPQRQARARMSKGRGRVRVTI